MKRILYFLGLGSLALTFQTTLLGSVAIQGIRPDIMLIFTLFLGFSCPPVLGAILAFLMGYFVDLFSGNALGLYAFTRPLLFYWAYLFKSKFYAEGFQSRFIVVFLSACFEWFLLLLLLMLFNPEPLSHLPVSFLAFLLPQSLSTALIAPLLLAVFGERLWFVKAKSEARLQEKG